MKLGFKNQRKKEETWIKKVGGSLLGSKSQWLSCCNQCKNIQSSQS